MVLWLTDQETAAAASWSAKIDAIADALLDWSNGDALSGARSDYHFLPETADAAAASEGPLLDFRTMFGLWPRRRIAALRVANHTYTFTAGSSPRTSTDAVLAGDRIPAFVLVFDASTGATLALVPDMALQRDRVAATAAAGARVLARGDSRRLGLIGTGHIAEGYVAALASVLPIESVMLFSPNADHAAAFAAAVRTEHGIDARAVSSMEEAAKADVVCVATNSRRPVIDGGWLEPGTHLITTNLFEPEPNVVDAADVAVITCRDRDDGWRLAGTALPAQERQVAQLLGGHWGDSDAARPRLPLGSLPDLGEVLAGRAHGRRATTEITYHVNQSAGIQFAAIAAAIVEGAVRVGLGSALPDELFSTGKPRRVVDDSVVAAATAPDTHHGGS